MRVRSLSALPIIAVAQSVKQSTECDSIYLVRAIKSEPSEELININGGTCPIGPWTLDAFWHLDIYCTRTLK